MSARMRAEFEAEFKRKFPLTYQAALSGESKAHGDLSNAWWGWEASRQALEVERCIGLEREVKRMTDAVARINGLERLLRNCRLELKDWMRSHGQDIETKEIIMAIDAALANQEQKP